MPKLIKLKIEYFDKRCTTSQALSDVLKTVFCFILLVNFDSFSLILNEDRRRLNKSVTFHVFFMILLHSDIKKCKDMFDLNYISKLFCIQIP